MPKDLSPVALARQASALTIEDAARITGMSVQLYQQVEERPLGFTVGELRALCSEFNRDGRSVMGEWLKSFLRL